jgi:hypothetical protein
MKKNNKRFLIRIGFIACILLTAFAFGQTRTTVLLNQSTNAEKYVFNPKSLPSNLVINEDYDNVLFNITIRENNLDKNGIQNLYIYKNGDLNSSVGAQNNISKNTKAELQIPLNLHSELPTLRTNLELVSKFSVAYIQNKIFFYPLLPGTTNYQLNNQPKLVINYEVTKEPYNANWSQNGANAQHTNALDWKWNSTNSEISFSNVLNNATLSNIQVDKTLLYKEKPVVFYTDNSTFYVSLLNASLQKFWTYKLDGFPTVKPVIDQQGRMYVVKEGTFKIINLETGQEIEKFNLYDKLNNYFNQAKALSVTNDITIGYDGTLYLPIATDGRVGIVALSAYPDLKPRWYYPTTNPVGPISLSNQEHLAFFLESDSQKQKSKLVVLNNINGTVLANSKTTLAAFSNDIKNYYIPPVVVKKANQKYNLYVLNGNKFADKLFVFEVQDDILTSKETKPLTLEPTKEIASSNNISQPVLSGEENVYFIMANTLTKYDAQKNTTETVVTNSPSFSFDKESVILANATNQLVINSKSGMYYVDANAANHKVTQLLSFSGNNEPYKSIMNPNLSVYHFTSNKCNFTKAFGGSMTFGFTELSAFDNNTVYHSSKIKIKNKATIPYTVSTIITAKNIGIGKEFSIQKGANVSFKIN